VSVRALACLTLTLVALAAACSGSGGAKDVKVSLRIAVWPEGRGAARPRRDWRLACNPLDGSLPHGDRACYRLATMRRPFAPVPPGTACSQIYGGPQEARVVGTVRGRAVDAAFRRTDGCEIARWNRFDFLFPPRP
jgi:hypothetical protein